MDDVRKILASLETDKLVERVRDSWLGFAINKEEVIFQLESLKKLAEGALKLEETTRESYEQALKSADVFKKIAEEANASTKAVLKMAR